MKFLKSKCLSMNNRITPEKIITLPINAFMVFGSNEQGIHRAGAAKDAVKFGAKHGLGYGFSGRTFAIPTRRYLGQGKFLTLPLTDIKTYVDRYLLAAKAMHHQIFLTTRIGCGYAGYQPSQIAPLFAEAVDLDHIHLPQDFWDILNQM